MLETLSRRPNQRITIRPKQDAGELHSERVRQLAPLTE